jgi:hypothetical protein
MVEQSTHMVPPQVLTVLLVVLTELQLRLVPFNPETKSSIVPGMAVTVTVVPIHDIGRRILGVTNHAANCQYGI